MKTVLITGCSSGFGLEIARYFLARDWQVVATMRTPREACCRRRRTCACWRSMSEPRQHPRGDRRRRPDRRARQQCGFRCGRTAELMPIDTVRALFETNTIGTIAVTQAVLPQLRQRGAGVVVNVTSSVTLKVLPLLAAYRASKAAVNAYTESVALELAPFGVRAHLVLPGRAPDTRFADNARAHMHGFEHEAYAEFAAAVFARIVDEAAPITTRRTSPKPCGARRPIRRARCAFRPAPMPSRGRRKRAEARRHGTNRLAGETDQASSFARVRRDASGLKRAAGAVAGTYVHASRTEAIRAVLPVALGMKNAGRAFTRCLSIRRPCTVAPATPPDTRATTPSRTSAATGRLGTAG